MYLIFLDKKKKSSISMFLKLFLSFFIFFSLSTWVFANPCEEAFSSGAGGVFISFVKKQMGKEFETELPANWSDKIVEKTKHWTREEALQFLDFLINRRGELSTVEHLESLADLSSTISFKDFMNKVNFYDRINKDIIDELLNREREEFEFLLTNNDINTVKIQQLNQLIESYVGKKGASYVMRDLILERDGELNNPNLLKEMRKVLNFVDSYTKKHGVVTDTLDNRVNFFKQFVSLPREERPLPSQLKSKIQFSNFSELREFSELIFDKLEQEEKISELVGELYSLKRILTFSLQNIIKVKITNLFSAYYELKLSDLRKVVKIFEQYIPPAEVANILMNETGIYAMNPKRLKEVIRLLEGAYDISVFAQQEWDVAIGKLLDNVAAKNQKELTPQERREYVKLLNKTPKEFIGHIIKTQTELLLLKDPTNLKETITILESYINRSGLAFSLRGREYLKYQSDLLVTNPYYLQRIINILEKYFQQNEMVGIIGMHFSAMGRIKNSDAFVEIMEILSARIDKQDVFFRRVIELFEFSEDFFSLDVFISEIRDELVELSNTMDHNKMAQLLRNTHLLKFSRTMQSIKESIINKEESQKSSSLH